MKPIHSMSRAAAGALTFALLLAGVAGLTGTVAQPAQNYQGPVSTSGDLTGLWRGQSSQNVVSINSRPGGFDVRAVTSNPGQGVPAFFQAAPDGTYRISLAKGEYVVRILGADMIRITNPDGWTDVFDRAR